jgi:hypothetical protein
MYYADPSNPQSFNLYAYVQNNPLVNFDPDGLDCFTTSNLTSTSVTVTTHVGVNCDGIKGGTYVDGTINTKSYGAAVGDDGDVHVSFTYTPSDAGSGSVGADGTYTMQGPSWGSKDIGATSNIDPDVARIDAMVQGVATNTASMPWVCNASLSLRGQIPKTPIQVGGTLDFRNGLQGSYGVRATNQANGEQLAVRTNGKQLNAQYSVPIPDTPFRATLELGAQHPTVGINANVPWTKNIMSAGGSLSVGYLGDASCR